MTERELSEEEIAELRRLEQAATDVPWIYSARDSDGELGVRVENYQPRNPNRARPEEDVSLRDSVAFTVAQDCYDMFECETNMQLIAAARNALVPLLDALERLRTERDEARKEVETHEIRCRELKITLRQLMDDLVVARDERDEARLGVVNLQQACEAMRRERDAALKEAEITRDMEADEVTNLSMKVLPALRAQLEKADALAAQVDKEDCWVNDYGAGERIAQARNAYRAARENGGPTP